ncbi:MAG: hypothetical protein JWP81_4129 [Ferruginibacter sp.]|nr:hypothetical protein [Ferruginibacter sp.]
MENTIILSICIPTYNRSDNLRETIFSIVNQKRFQETNDVEIVLLDNGSTDDTRIVINDLATAHGQKIICFRNELNNSFLDLEKLFSLANGDFLKFNNDTLAHKQGSLDNMIETICFCKKDGTIPFFSTGELRNKKNILCSTVDSFVENASYFSTWMGAFGIWKNDFLHFKDFSRHLPLRLPQVDILFRLIISQKPILIDDKKLFISLPVKKKGGYDLLTVFLDNYIFLLSEQLKDGRLSKKIFRSEKRKLLLKFIIPWLVDIRLYPDRYYFECENSFRRIMGHYENDKPTLFKCVIIYPFLFIKKAMYSLFLQKKLLNKSFNVL